MTRFQTLCLGICVWMFGTNLSLWAQKNGIELSGIVTDNRGELLPGVAVYFHETRTGAYTDSAGGFLIRNIKPGTYHLHLDGLGYHSQSRTISISKSMTDLHFTLIPSELKTSEVVIESESDKRALQESSQTFSIVDRTYLEEYSTGNLVNTLERLPGVNAIRTGVGISKPVIRGMSFNRVLVVENGIRQEGQQWGADHGLEIDEQQADRVEILRGPGAVQHGGDAIGGVVVIRQAPLPSSQHWQGSATLTARTLNDLRGGHFMAAANTGGIAWRIRGGQRTYADYRVPADRFLYNRYVLPIYEGRLKNTAGKEENLSVTTGLQRTWGNTEVFFSRFHQEAGFFSGAFGIPRAISLNPDGNFRNIQLPRQVTTHTKVSSHSNILLRKNWLEIDAGYQRNDRREEALPHTQGVMGNSNLALNLILETWSANLKYHHQVKEKLSFIYGGSGQYQNNSIGGFEHLLPAYQSFNGGAFAFSQYKPHPDWVWNMGLRYDGGEVKIAKAETVQRNMAGVVTDTMIRNLESHRIFANVSGSGGFAWKPSDFWSFKANLSSDFRFPTVAELAANGVHHGTFRHVQGNRFLSPERGLQGDLAAEYKHRKIRVSLSPFYGHFFNYIYLSPSGRFSTLPEAGQIFSYMESPARFIGGEMEWEFSPWKPWHFTTSLEYVKGTNRFTGIPLPFMPPANALVEVRWEKNNLSRCMNRLYLTGSLQAYADQRLTDRNEPPTPGYTLYQLGGGIHVKVGGQEVRLMVQVQNLSNRPYLNHLSRYRMLEISEPGRNLVFTLNVPLKGTFHSKEKGSVN